MLFGCSRSSPHEPMPAPSAKPATPSAAPHGDVLVTEAYRLLHESTEVRVIGDIPDTGGTVEHYDITYHGRDFRGRLTLNGMTEQFRFVGGVGYLNDPAAVERGTDRWVTGPSTTSAVAKEFPLAKIVSRLGSVPQRSAVSTTTLGRRPVYDVYDAGGNHYIVAAAGKPYLLQAKGSLPGTLSFSEYDETPQVTAPMGSSAETSPVEGLTA